MTTPDPQWFNRRIDFTPDDAVFHSEIAPTWAKQRSFCGEGPQMLSQTHCVLLDRHKLSLDPPRRLSSQPASSRHARACHKVRKSPVPVAYSCTRCSPQPERSLLRRRRRRAHRLCLCVRRMHRMGGLSSPLHLPRRASGFVRPSRTVLSATWQSRQGRPRVLITAVVTRYRSSPHAPTTDDSVCYCGARVRTPHAIVARVSARHTTMRMGGVLGGGGFASESLRAPAADCAVCDLAVAPGKAAGTAHGGGHTTPVVATCADDRRQRLLVWRAFAARREGADAAGAPWGRGEHERGRRWRAAWRDCRGQGGASGGRR